MAHTLNAILVDDRVKKSLERLPTTMSVIVVAREAKPEIHACHITKSKIGDETIERKRNMGI